MNTTNISTQSESWCNDILSVMNDFNSILHKKGGKELASPERV